MNNTPLSSLAPKALRAKQLPRDFAIAQK